MTSAGVSLNIKTDVHFIDTEKTNVISVNLWNFWTQKFNDYQIAVVCIHINYWLQLDGAFERQFDHSLPTLIVKNESNRSFHEAKKNKLFIIIVFFDMICNFFILGNVYMALYSDLNPMEERLRCK